MKLSKTRLLDEAAATGFRPDTLEKVIHLLQLLSLISENEYLRERLVLKGGTALNLFIFDIPRLSVDIDLNYVGAVDLETMNSERPQLEGLLTAICERSGYKLNRVAMAHAGGKWRLGYQSALGGQANLELDLNYMFRLNFHPADARDSKKVGSFQAMGVKVLDKKELAAGKLSALLTRSASRDLFDTSNLFELLSAPDEDLRLVFVLYGAMNPRANWCELSAGDVKGDLKDLREKLLPVLKVGRAPDAVSQKEYFDSLIKQCRQLVEPLFPLRENEREFVSLLRDNGEIRPELITDDNETREKIRCHPGILRRASMAKRNRLDKACEQF
ncbi:MAG: nucleotidyl transferase AbiEii/AbiGii toxin family protein [Cyanobacteriota/Melainabacteria group bacterium]